jgi:hypothetical protein
MKIGEAHGNVRSATLLQFFVKFHLLLGMKQGLRCPNTIGAGWIGAPIYWRTDVPLRQ